MRIWMPAKTPFVSAGCAAMRCAMCVMTLERKPGWPWAEGRITLLAKAGPNISGWSCRRPSSSQMMPRPIWMVRALTRLTPGTRLPAHAWPSMIGASSARVRSGWNW